MERDFFRPGNLHKKCPAISCRLFLDPWGKSVYTETRKEWPGGEPPPADKEETPMKQAVRRYLWLILCGMVLAVCAAVRRKPVGVTSISAISPMR